MPGLVDFVRMLDVAGIHNSMNPSEVTMIDPLIPELREGHEIAKIMTTDVVFSDGSQEHSFVFIRCTGLLFGININRGPVSMFRSCLLDRNVSDIWQRDVSFDVRTANALHFNNIHTMADLCRKSENEVRLINRMGKVSMARLKATLDQIGLRLGMPGV